MMYERGKSTHGTMRSLDFFIIMGNANSAGIKSKQKNDIAPSPPNIPEVISIKRNIDNKLPKLKNRICQSHFGFLFLSDSSIFSVFIFSSSFGFIDISPFAMIFLSSFNCIKDKNADDKTSKRN